MALGVFAPWRSLHLWWRGRLGAVLASARRRRLAPRAPGMRFAYLVLLGPPCGFSLSMLPLPRFSARRFRWSLLLLCCLFLLTFILKSLILRRQMTDLKMH